MVIEAPQPPFWTMSHIYKKKKKKKNVAPLGHSRLTARAATSYHKEALITLNWDELALDPHFCVGLSQYYFSHISWCY